MDLKRYFLRVGLLLVVAALMLFVAAHQLGYTQILLWIFGALGFVLFFGCILIVLFRRTWTVPTELERFGSDFVIYGYGVWISLLVADSIGHTVLPWAGERSTLLMIVLLAILLLAYWMTLNLSESIRDVAEEIDEQRFARGIEEVQHSIEILNDPRGRRLFAWNFGLGVAVALLMTIVDLIPS